MISMKDVKDLHDLCGAVRVTTMVPHFMPLFSFALRLLCHHCLCSVIFHTGFSVECLLPAPVSVFQMNFYCWSLSCLPTRVSGCPLSCHTACYYPVVLICTVPFSCVQADQFLTVSPWIPFQVCAPFSWQYFQCLDFLIRLHFWFETLIKILFKTFLLIAEWNKITLCQWCIFFKAIPSADSAEGVVGNLNKNSEWSGLLSCWTWRIRCRADASLEEHLRSLNQEKQELSNMLPVVPLW